MTVGWGISCEIALIWMSLDLNDDQSTLVQVMAWCRQATSHYLSKCSPRSMLPYGVTRPQWVNSLSPERYGGNFKWIILQHIIMIAIMSISSEINLKWILQHFTHDESTLVQIMAWCCRARPKALSYRPGQVKIWKNCSSDRLYYHDTCPTGQVNNQEDSIIYNCADRCHFMQDR